MGTAETITLHFTGPAQKPLNPMNLKVRTCGFNFLPTECWGGKNWRLSCNQKHRVGRKQSAVFCFVVKTSISERLSF
jgi:hypothetical protein